MDIYYFAAWTECGCLLGCDHKHTTISDAVNCELIARAGSYVVAVDNGTHRALNSVEELEFHQARHKSPPLSVLEYEASCYAVMVPIRLVEGWGWETWMRFDTYEQARTHARSCDKIVRFGSSEWKALRQSREPALFTPSIAPLKRQVLGQEDVESPLIPWPVDENDHNDTEAPLRVSNEFGRPTLIDFVLVWINLWELKVLEKICALAVRAWLEALRWRVRTALTQK